MDIRNRMDLGEVMPENNQFFSLFLFLSFMLFCFISIKIRAFFHERKRADDEAEATRVFIVTIREEGELLKSYRIQGNFIESYNTDITEIRAITVEGKKLIIRASKFANCFIEEV